MSQRAMGVLARDGPAVCVGVAETRVLAKLANKSAKQIDAFGCVRGADKP
ncbi:hypothetical protein GCM10010922_14960 [Microbacterium sorbitolivorans]|nr:hypothetical protein [Microbacterium sorbitolivorans]GGF40555.1 hypothetical protein GCM10010922_14960 [Microbacterium sorbitolivorans]